MESLLGLIVTFAIMIVASSLSKASKKNQKDSKSDFPQTTPAATPVAPPAPPAAAAPKASKLSSIEMELQQKATAMKQAPAGKAAARAILKNASRLQCGESVTDEAGCVGGSLGAHSEEGEHPAEHALHLQKRDKALAAEAAQAHELRNISVQELRKAVIVSEILDKPVALRRR